MLVGRWLFHPVDGDGDWTEEDDHLAKMMELTSERFGEDMLSRSTRRQEFFDPGGTPFVTNTQNDTHVLLGNLLRIEELCPVSIEDALDNYKILAAEEVSPAADFIRFCCRLNPEDRPTAEQVASHAWLSRSS